MCTNEKQLRVLSGAVQPERQQDSAPSILPLYCGGLAPEDELHVFEMCFMLLTSSVGCEVLDCDIVPEDVADCEDVPDCVLEPVICTS